MNLIPVPKVLYFLFIFGLLGCGIKNIIDTEFGWLVAGISFAILLNITKPV